MADLKRDHSSRLRTPLIAEPFYRRALIEKWGRGTQKIVEICRAEGHPEPEFFEQAVAVTVRFPLGTYSVPAEGRGNLSERQRRILSILSDGREWSATMGTPNFAHTNPTGPDVLVPAEAVPNTLLDDRHS